MVAPQGDYLNVSEEGMTMRDYFAGQALIAIVTSGKMRGEERTESGIAEEAYVFADVMLAEREQRGRR